MTILTKMLGSTRQVEIWTITNVVACLWLRMQPQLLTMVPVWGALAVVAEGGQIGESPLPGINLSTGYVDTASALANINELQVTVRVSFSVAGVLVLDYTVY